MTINQSALLKASAVSIVITVILIGISIALSNAMGISPGTIPSQEQSLEMVSHPLFPAISALGCFGIVLSIVFGMLYGVFAKDDAPINVGQFAIGGALVGVIVGVVGSLIEALPVLPNMEQASLQLEQAAPQLAGQSIVTYLVLNALFEAVISAGLGAVGGAIYGSLAQSRQIKNPPSM